jgi:hypothetical protein
LDFKIYEKVLKNNFIISFTFHQNLKKFLDNLDQLVNKYYFLMQLNILLENKNSEYLYKYAIKNKIKYIFTQIYDSNEYFLNPFLFKKLDFVKKHNINLFQDKIYYPDLILKHYKLKNKKKICYFNEGLIDLNLIYTDECRNIIKDLKKENIFKNFKNYKKPIICNKKCGDCYGKIICNKRVW